MTTAQLARRVQALEQRNQPPARVVVCWCTLPDDQHNPDCPAACDNDDGITIYWDEDDDD